MPSDHLCRKFNRLQPRGSTLFYVDADVGHDANPGTLNKPFQTIQRAILDSRKISGHRSILLREGTFYLDATLELDSRDSDLYVVPFSLPPD